MAAGALLAYPLRLGRPLLDDFVYLALSRHIEGPWALIAQDSLGTYFFRPLVMLVWWLTVGAFGTEPSLHYAFNVAMHVANGLLAYGLLRAYRIAFTPAAAAALLFIVHPAAFSASAWLSDRFDLFATAFGLCMLIALERHLQAPRRKTFAFVVLSALATVWSKEIGFAMLAVGAIAIAWRGEAQVATRRERWVLFAAIAACGLFAIALRQIVLRDAPEGMFFGQGIAATLAVGIAKWTQGLPGFLVVFQGNEVGVAAWCAALAALLALPLLPAVRAAFVGSIPARTCGLGLAMMTMAAAAQAPVAKVIPLIPYTLERFDFAALAASRFYYVPMAGFALFAAAILEATLRAPLPRHLRMALAVLLVAALTGLAASSRSIGRDWARYTQDRSDVFVRAAVRAVLPLGVAPGCHLFLLETPPAARHFRDVADTAVKAMLPPGHAAISCFIQGEHAPWNHLVDTRRLAGDEHRPMQVIRLGGAAFEPLRVSNLTHYYLAIPGGDAAIDNERALFFAYRAGEFHDVTAEIRSRRRAVRFYDDRPLH